METHRRSNNQFKQSMNDLWAGFVACTLLMLQVISGGLILGSLVCWSLYFRDLNLFSITFLYGYWACLDHRGWKKSPKSIGLFVYLLWWGYAVGSIHPYIMAAIFFGMAFFGNQFRKSPYRGYLTAIFLLWLAYFTWTLLYLSVILIYGYWVVYDDEYRKSPYKGTRRSEWWRRHPLHKAFRDYLSAELRIPHKLDPTRKYVFGLHPHGIISMGSYVNFCTEANNSTERLAGIDFHVLTLNAVCRNPIAREFVLATGSCSVEKASCNYLLGQGKSVMIVVGGAQEALDTEEGKLPLTIANRYGFVKVALENGADLVPVISFGENSLYKLYRPTGIFRKIQEIIKRSLTFSMPFFYGRAFGLLPFKHKVVTIIGEPIRLEAADKENIDPKNISSVRVKYYHALYLQKLQELFDANKDEFSEKELILK